MSTMVHYSRTGVKYISPFAKIPAPDVVHWFDDAYCKKTVCSGDIHAALRAYAQIQGGAEEMNCYKCNLGGLTPDELVKHEQEMHDLGPQKPLERATITTEAAIEKRIAEAVAAEREACLTIVGELELPPCRCEACECRRRIAAAIRARAEAK